MPLSELWFIERSMSSSDFFIVIVNWLENSTIQVYIQYKPRGFFFSYGDFK